MPRARRDAPLAKTLNVVGLDLTPEARSGLVDGVVDIILSHPIKLLAETTVDLLATVTAGGDKWRARPMAAAVRHLHAGEFVTRPIGGRTAMTYLSVSGFMPSRPRNDRNWPRPYSAASTFTGATWCLCSSMRLAFSAAFRAASES